MRKEQVCVYLYRNCRGKNNLQSAKNIRSSLQIGENELRKQVHRLRKDGIPIASDTKGYYFAANAGEVYSTIRNLRKMREGLDAALKGLERAMENFKGGDSG